MSLFSKFSSKEVDAFANEIADTLSKRYPPTLERSPQKRISPNRVSRVLEDVLGRAAEFTQTRKLGTYRKARLANTFRWRLEDLGYSKEFIELATEGLVVYVTRGAKKAAEDGKSA